MQGGRQGLLGPPPRDDSLLPRDTESLEGSRANAWPGHEELERQFPHLPSQTWETPDQELSPWGKASWQSSLEPKTPHPEISMPGAFPESRQDIRLPDTEQTGVEVVGQGSKSKQE